MIQEGPMQQRSEETRDRILQAAEKMFALRGYEGTGVAEICSAAGVSKGAFYHHFTSKQAVFDTLLMEWLHGLDRGQIAVRQNAGDVPETLIRMSGMMREVFQVFGGRLPIFLEFWTQASRDPEVRETTISHTHGYEAFFTSIVEDGIAEGSLRPVDAAIAARVIVSLAVGVLLQGLLDPQRPDWEQVTQEAMQFLIHGLAKGKTGGKNE
jgi:AcrR family transcriptional regulator